MQKVRVSFAVGGVVLALLWDCSGLNLCAMKEKVVGEPYFQLRFFDRSRKTFLSSVLIKKIGSDGCGRKNPILNIKVLSY